MDHRPVVNETAAAPADSVEVDQAVFTSIRSPMGEGYRIIAASPGVRAEEKAEITRRAPSHASLCSSEPNAVGLLSFPLARGRHCVAYCRYAGKEHTARGGLRVYAHWAVLDQDVYRRFGCNPVRVHAALENAINNEPILKPPPGLGRLSLVVPALEKSPPLDKGRVREGFSQGDSQINPPQSPLIEGGSKGNRSSKTSFRNDGASNSPERIEAILCFAQAMLHGESVLGVGFDSELGLVYKTTVALPLAVRKTLSVSVGLKYAPSRGVALALVSRDRGETQRLIRGRKITWFDGDATPARGSSDFNGWFELIGDWLRADRDADVDDLTQAMTDDVSPSALDRIASISLDIDSIETADEIHLAGLIEKYESFESESALEARLLQELTHEAGERATQLRKEGEPAETCRPRISEVAQ